MKKIITTIALSVSALFAVAQIGAKPTVPQNVVAGLTAITVERYYVTNAADSVWAYNQTNSNATNYIGNGGVFHTNMVTYRVYAKVATGYKLYQVYGNATHPLTLSTTTDFFNTDDGSYFPFYSKINLPKKGLAMIDSWLTIGNATSDGYYGILKGDQAGSNGMTNTNAGVLRNSLPFMGAALTSEAGVSGTKVINTTPVGSIGDNGSLLGLFQDGSVVGNSFTDANGSYSSAGGQPGLSTDTNKILIGQFTTNGTFSYSFNIQISNGTTTFNYVPSNPSSVANKYEYAFPALSGSVGPFEMPSVAVTAPVNNYNASSGDSVLLTASASQTGGGIASVQFYLDSTTAIGNAITTAPYNFKWKSLSGNHKITAVATDIYGDKSRSLPINIMVAVPTPPKVNITAPIAATKFITGDTVAIKVATWDSVQTVTSVQYFVNRQSIGTSTTSPFNLSWVATQGADTITAVATNNIGLQTTAAIVVINVVNDTPPLVSLTTPQNATQYIVGDQVSIAATASSITQGGSVTSVEFFVNGKSIGKSSSAPYKTSLLAALGNDTIVAVATDNRNVTNTSSPVVIAVNAPAAPTVQITAPMSSRKVITGDTVSITASASDNNQGGGITSVQFFVNGVSMGTSTTAPYAIQWISTQGTDTLMAIATNNRSVTASSAKVILNVMNDVAPSIAITSPKSGMSFVIGDAVSINATANSTDTNGYVTSVEYLINGQPIGSSSTNPAYHFNWKSNVTGMDTLVAIATDNRGGQMTSAPILLNVHPKMPPIVKLVAMPDSGAVVVIGDTVKFTVLPTILDTNGMITSVQYMVNHKAINTTAVAPFNYTWISNQTGNDTIMVLVTDNRNQVVNSNLVVIKVNAKQAPMVNVTAPANNTVSQANTPVVITASAMDLDTNGAIVSVKFYVNNVLVSTATSAPYAYTWTPGTVGLDSITAVATDKRGEMSTSSKVYITIDQNTGLVNIAVNPAVSIYPNPAAETLNVSFANGLNANQAEMNIYGIDGKCIMHKSYAAIAAGQVERINLSALAPGQYFIEILSNNQRITKRFMKD